MAEPGFEPTWNLESSFQILVFYPPPMLLSKQQQLKNQKQYIQCMRNASLALRPEPWSFQRGRVIPATSATQRALVTSLEDYSVSASSLPLLAVIILMFLQQFQKKKWFCFYKRKEPKICILGFINNPYKNTRLERF